MNEILGFLMAILGVVGLGTLVAVTVVFINVWLGFVSLGISALLVWFLMPRWAKWIVEQTEKKTKEV